MASIGPDWEEDKENIRPSVRGQNPYETVASRQLSAEEISNQMEAMARQFDLALEAEAEDPVVIAMQLVHFVETKMPSNQMVLLHVLEDVTARLGNIPMYRNDVRVVQLWTTLASLYADPRPVFAYMRDQSIGELVALCYIAYSRTLELFGEYEKALDVLEDGLGRRAHPLSRISRRLQDLEKRIAEKVSAGAVEQPKTLPILSLRAEHGGERAVLSSAPLQVHTGGLGDSISIYHDPAGDARGGVVPPSWSQVPRADEHLRENVLDADLALGQRGTLHGGLGTLKGPKKPSQGSSVFVEVQFRSQEELAVKSKLKSKSKSKSRSKSKSKSKSGSMPPMEERSWDESLFPAQGEYSFEEYRASLARYRPSSRRRSDSITSLSSVSSISSVSSLSDAGGREFAQPEPMPKPQVLSFGDMPVTPFVIHDDVLPPASALMTQPLRTFAQSSISSSRSVSKAVFDTSSTESGISFGLVSDTESDGDDDLTLSNMTFTTKEAFDDVHSMFKKPIFERTPPAVTPQITPQFLRRSIARRLPFETPYMSRPAADKVCVSGFEDHASALRAQQLLEDDEAVPYIRDVPELTRAVTRFHFDGYAILVKENSISICDQDRAAIWCSRHEVAVARALAQLDDSLFPPFSDVFRGERDCLIVFDCSPADLETLPPPSTGDLQLATRLMKFLLESLSVLRSHQILLPFITPHSLRLWKGSLVLFSLSGAILYDCLPSAELRIADVRGSFQLWIPYLFGSRHEVDPSLTSASLLADLEAHGISNAGFFATSLDLMLFGSPSDLRNHSRSF